MSDEWDRVAAAIFQRREKLGLTQEEAAARSEGMISTANWRVIEKAGRTRYRTPTIRGVQHALRWSEDSIARIRSGKPPVILPEPTESGEPEPEVTILDLSQRVGKIEQKLEVVLAALPNLQVRRETRTSLEVVGDPKPGMPEGIAAQNDPDLPKHVDAARAPIEKVARRQVKQGRPK